MPFIDKPLEEHFTWLLEKMHEDLQVDPYANKPAEPPTTTTTTTTTTTVDHAVLALRLVYAVM